MVAIFVAFMFVGLVLTDLAVEKLRAPRVVQLARAASPRAGAIMPEFETLCRVPDGVHLAPQHTWVRPDPRGGLEIGADALIACAVGKVRRIVLPKVGDQVAAGEPLFRLERHGCTVTIPSASRCNAESKVDGR